MSKSGIAPHEKFQVHELLQLKNICALKVSSLTGMVDDPKLRVILETELENSQTQIKELREFMQ
ncbi:MAG: hypothetical protein GX434_05105 [Peptococcaceae bacterium]|nr:hypothetical protein [Peptococcaceae bacterium]